MSLSKGGSEDGTLHVFDSATGSTVGEVIPRVNFPTAGGGLAWSADGRGFWYTRYPGAERPEADRHFYVQVYFHRLGDDPAKDARVFGDGLPKIAEIQLDYSPAADALLVSVQNGDGGEFCALRLAARTAASRRSRASRTAWTSPRSAPTARSTSSASATRRAARS